MVPPKWRMQFCQPRGARRAFGAYGPPSARRQNGIVIRGGYHFAAARPAGMAVLEQSGISVHMINSDCQSDLHQTESLTGVLLPPISADWQSASRYGCVHLSSDTSPKTTENSNCEKRDRYYQKPIKLKTTFSLWKKYLLYLLSVKKGAGISRNQ